MKKSKNGLLQLLGLVVIIAAIAAFLIAGIKIDKVPGFKDIRLGLDLNGGLSITYETNEAKPDSEKLDMTIYRMQKRIENQKYGAEAQVYRQGDNRICVDIPGAKDAEKILADLGNSGNVYFIYGRGEKGIDNIKEVTVDGHTKYELTRTIEEIIADGDCVLDGSDVQDANAQSYQSNQPGVTGTSNIVELKLKESSQTKFLKGTTYCSKNYYLTKASENYYARFLAIVYDGEVISAPGCENPIDSDTATISGSFTFDEVKNLATTIKIGALPLELHQLQYSIVGAKLGTNALNTILIAGVIGLGLVILFMICFYRLPGWCAGISLAIYTGLMIGCLLLFNVTLTLPGIAGIILSIGMAVDGNIIIFTRIKEELRAGKTVRSSIKLGFGKATSAIIDGNVTTLIAAIVLYLRGSGTIRGFAVTLAIGIILSVISSLLICRFVMMTFYNLGMTAEKWYGIAKETKVINFTKHWIKYTIISGALIIAGIVGLIVGQAKSGKILNYGLDFVGGTSIEVYFDSADKVPANLDIEKLAGDVLGSAPEIVKVDADNAIIMKTEQMFKEDSSNNKITELKEALNKAYGVTSENIEVQSISASVSGEMKADAIWAVVISAIAMLLYIWIRFRNISFGVSSVLALMHDVLVVLMVYSVFRVTVDNSFIACMLTIVGYSINATIVIFDRIRENLAEMGKKETVDDVVNRSISETLSRSINTSITTLITIVMIVVLGVDSIREFAIPLMVGMICGAYSSVCIAGSLWLAFAKKSKKKKAN